MRTIFTIKYIMFFAAILSALTLAVVLSGCGDDDSGKVETATAAAETSTGPTAGEISYAKDISDLTAYGDDLNDKYNALLGEYENGNATKEDVIAKAEESGSEYQMLLDNLTLKSPPEVFQEAHQKIIAAFSKWLSYYQLQAAGVRDNDANLLQQARDLDNQAVTEANQAISEINQVVNPIEGD